MAEHVHKAIKLGFVFLEIINLVLYDFNLIQQFLLRCHIQLLLLLLLYGGLLLLLGFDFGHQSNFGILCVE